jgi:hypothetical protein
LDARESSKDAQDPSRKKLAFRLPATFPLIRQTHDNDC